MKAFTVLFVVAAAIATVSCLDSTVFDINYDQFLKDEPQKKETLACLLDQGPCKAPELQKIKDTLPETITQKCASCSPEDKAKVEQIKKIMSEKYPDVYKSVMDKYAPKA